MTGQIRTVLGDLAPDALGVTQAHEHLIILGGVPVLKVPEFRIDDVQKAIEEVAMYRRAGGGALVDMMPIGCGRDPRGLAEVSRATGVHVVSATGFHREFYYDDLHWIHRYSAEQIAELLVRELVEGMDQNGFNGPFPDYTDSRAGIIKLASDYHYISETGRKLFRAAALAHRQTGAPISTHTEHGTMAEAQLDLLERLGVNPGRVIIGHVDHNPDYYVHRRLASRGAYLGYDRMHRTVSGSDADVVALLLRMVEGGFGDRVLLSVDVARRSRFKAYGGGPGLTYVLEHVVPRLREEGLSEGEVEQIMVRNPARALTWGLG